MSGPIPYGRQWIDDADIAEVVSVLRSDFLTQGPKVAEFERQLCEATTARHCVAVANGTAALHLAVQALDVPAGSEGITSPNSFVATANAMLYCGITPVFADIEEESGNLAVESVRAHRGSRIRLLIPVHFAGAPADSESLAALARREGWNVIEDAAHALGSRYPDGRPVGSNAFSDLTIFSFHPVKAVTTAEGGAVTTNSDELAARLRLLRSHGIDRPQGAVLRERGPWYYEVQALGFNYRLSDVHAALGCSQLRRLATFVARRRELAARYTAAFADLPWLATPRERSGAFSAYHLYVVRCRYEALGLTRAELMRRLRERGVGSQVHYIPIYRHPYYRRLLGDLEHAYPATERYYAQCLSLPLFPSMTDAEQQRVIEEVRALG